VANLAGLIGRHEISTQEIVARGRAPGAGKPFGIIHSLACRAFNFRDLFAANLKLKTRVVEYTSSVKKGIFSRHTENMTNQARRKL
jgi:hypothetical protein